MCLQSRFDFLISDTVLFLKCLFEISIVVFISCMLTGYTKTLENVVVDEDHGFIYWVNEGAIYQATLNGDNETLVFRPGKLNVILLSKNNVKKCKLQCLADSVGFLSGRKLATGHS